MLNKEQSIFFNELAHIQDYCINVTLSKEDKYCSTEELLKDVTSEVIYRIMESQWGEWNRRDNVW